MPVKPVTPSHLAGVRRWQAHRDQARAAWAAHRALLADEARCMHYVAPQGQPVYSELKGEIEAMLQQPDCAPSWGAQSHTICGMSPPPSIQDDTVTALVRFSSLLWRFPIKSSGSSAYIGGRRSASGSERLVIGIVAPPVEKPASTGARSLDFRAFAFSPAGPAPDQPPITGRVTPLSIPVPPGTRVRVLAGRSDPSDGARFTIRYELNDTPGTVAGRLNDDGTVALEKMPR